MGRSIWETHLRIENTDLPCSRRNENVYKKVFYCGCSHGILNPCLILGGIGLLGDDRTEKLTTGAARIGHLAMVVFLILLAGWIGYMWWKQRIGEIIPY